MTQAQVLVYTFQLSRNLTERYIQRALKGDILQQIEVGEIKLNCSQWLIAHIAWAEHALLLQALGSTIRLPDSLSAYKIGSSATPTADWPDIDVIIADMKIIHNEAMHYVSLLSDESLNEPNLSGLKFGEDNSKRISIQHAIRHEAMHCGHLSWICKLQGLK